MPLLGNKTIKNQIKKIAITKPDSQYVQSLREVLKFQKSKNVPISNYSQYSHFKSENKKVNTIYNSCHKSDKNLKEDKQINDMTQSKAYNHKFIHKKRYSWSFYQQNPNNPVSKVYLQEPNFKKIKITNLSQEQSNQCGKRNFRTMDKKLIKNYMNAVLIRFNYNNSEISKANNSSRSPNNKNLYKNGVRHKTLYSTETDLGESQFKSKNREREIKVSSGYFLPHPFFQSQRGENSSKKGKQARIEEQKEENQKKKIQKDIKEHSKQTTRYKDMNQSNWKKINPLELQTYFYKLKKMLIKQPQIKSQLKSIEFSIPSLPQKGDLTNFIKSYTPINKNIDISKILIQPTFQVIYSKMNDGNYSLYFGETMEEDPTIKQGKGILITDKYLYEGEWKGDVKITGLEKTALGIYRGTFKNNKRDGEGQFHWSCGQYYSGEWKEGKKSGTGYWKSSLDQSYMGEWSNGQVNGYGIHKLKSDRIYEGEFKNFLQHGKGKEKFPNGDRYEGNYQMGHPHGQGIYHWKNGYTYQGEFREGYREGRGKIFLCDKIEFNGQFEKQEANGKGVMKYENGDVFEGEYKGSKREGEGILRLREDRKIIKGIWKQNEILKDKDELQKQLFY